MNSNSEPLILENDTFIARINIMGAELKSLYSKTEKQEYIWPGKPGSWERSAPVLFPFVGKSLDNKVNFEGSDYPMPQHGFARDMEFTTEEIQEARASFILTENEATFKHFPYRFTLRISYTLEKNGILISYEVMNEDDKEMKFSLGTHPGFNLPSGIMSDYELEFGEEEELKRDYLRGGFLADEQYDFTLEGGRTIRLAAECFAEDAWVFRNVKSKELRIKGPGLSEGLKVYWENLPFLGIWSKYPNQDFICIEPWHGTADYAYPSRTREGLIMLKPQENFTASLGISIEKF